MVKHGDPVLNYAANSISLNLKLKKYKELQKEKLLNKEMHFKRKKYS